MLQIEKKDDLNYELITNDCKLDENKNILSRNNCWFVFKKSKIDEDTQNYKLNQGDIIRFGRITTRIKEINIGKNTNNNNTNKDSIKENSININETKTLENGPKINVLRFSNDFNKDKYINLTSRKNMQKNLIKSTNIHISKSIKRKIPKICRICYEEEDPLSNYDNPLVQPCTCSGSLRYIHFNCLKQWLNTKSCNKIFNNEDYSVFLVQAVQCEICKTKFPDFVKHKDKLYEILDFKSEFENFFTIESLTLDKHNTKFIYVVNLDKNKKLRIGRGKDSSITLGDISVSRVHAILTIENKNIYIRDNNSKFGTLILVQSPSLKLIQNLPLYIQIGRTFLECKIKKINTNIFSCCDINEKPNNNYYYQQNENQKQIELLNMFNIKSEIDLSEDNCEEKDNGKYITNEDENDIKDRYDENTLDIEDINNNKIKIVDNDNELKGNIIINKKSLFGNNENKNEKEEKSEEKSKSMRNKSESIFLESENEKVPKNNNDKLITSS